MSLRSQVRKSCTYLRAYARLLEDAMEAGNIASVARCYANIGAHARLMRKVLKGSVKTHGNEG